MIKCNCNREFLTQRSLNSHARFCKKFIKKEKTVSKYKIENIYKCECEKTFEKANSLNGHFSYCNIHQLALGKTKIQVDKFKDSRAWSKGLTYESDERIKKSVDKLKNKYKSGELQPPFKGRTHTDESKIKISLRRMELMNSNESHCKWYKISNGEIIVSVQGTWEKRIGETLTKLGEKWERKRIQYNLCHFYTADFYLPLRNMYIEVKGWWKKSDIIKTIKILEEHNIDLRIIDSLNEIKQFETNILKIDNLKKFNKK